MTSQREIELPRPAVLLMSVLDPRAFAVALGLVAGLIVFLATAVLLLKGGVNVGANLWLLGQVYPGYGVTWPGSILGFAYGFLTGFFVGYVFAVLRNFLVWCYLQYIQRRAEMALLSDLLER